MTVQIINATEIFDENRLRQVMVTLTDVFRDLRAGKEQSPQRLLLQHGPSEMLISPAAWRKRGVVSVKITTLTPGNSDHGLPLIDGIVVLTHINTGRVIALLDGANLTAVRTSAVAGLATSLCAPVNAGDLAILGAGVQARAVLCAMFVVRQIHSVRVFSRSAPKTEEFAQWVRATTGVKVTVCDTAFEAVHGADIICTTTSTSSCEPLIEADWVAPWAHLNIIGGTHKDAIEVDPALLKTAFIAVETNSAAQEEAGEIRAALVHGYIQPENLHELGALILGESTVGEGRITLFRSVGLAIEDTAAAIALYESWENI